MQKRDKIWEAETGHLNLICAIAMGFPSPAECSLRFAESTKVWAELSYSKALWDRDFSLSLLLPTTRLGFKFILLAAGFSFSAVLVLVVFQSDGSKV